MVSTQSARINASEDSDGPFGGFWPEAFEMGTHSETEQVTGRRRRS